MNILKSLAAAARDALSRPTDQKGKDEQQTVASLTHG